MVKATFDGRGADLIRLELLNQVDHNDRTRNVILFDQSAQRLYKAQSGLIPAAGGAPLPNHLTPMTVLPGDRTLAAGQNSLEVKFESAEVNGVKLQKTFRFERGSHLVKVRHEVVNNSAQAVDPQLYLQLVRDGNAPEGESSFYFTFTGPAIYTDAEKFNKIDFKDIEKRAAGVARRPSDHGRQRLGGDGAALLHARPGCWVPRPTRSAPASTTRARSTRTSIRWA